MEIHLEGVHKRYGDVDVVTALDVSLPSGKVVALLGPSGCGKTTTLRMIAGLERCTRGRIRLGDRVVDDGGGVYVPPEQRGLGMVFQSYALWPHKSVLDNVAYPLQLRGVRGAALVEKAKRALARVRLLDLAARFPHQLSGGQQQRVALARALVGDGERAPPVLLLDEPLANLDARLREDMRAELAAIARDSGATVVAVTHDQQEAFSLADVVIVLERGRLAQQGSPNDVYLRPATAFVGAFGGPMAFCDRVFDGESVLLWGRRMPPALLHVAPGVERGPCRVGVRPEWLHVEDGGAPATVVQTLFLGREHEVIVDVAGERLTLRLPSTAPAPARGATLSLVVERACVFPPLPTGPAATAA